ncbi:TPA: hypothetical protein JW623_005454, partial [Escherichia coli]|nr:hypothetical protein [Escherichia coli]
GGRVDCAIRRSGLTHRQVCRERRFRRDRGGATGTVAAGLVFQTSDRSGSPKPRQRVRRRLAGAPAAACRSRADDRMPPGSREPKVSTPPGIRTTETTKQKNASHHDGQEGQRRRRGPPVFQAGVSLPGFSGGPTGHTPAGAGE